ncbi:MAG: hypothetical protein K9G76_08300 [Bacteroidales bacterium]|nr:hypothetical protein [Bacteroidales bacterium]MCF8403513.1 hypothetical protein [Bacteroidales bacterium]
MKTMMLFLLLVIFFSFQLIASPNPVVKETTKGKMVKVYELVNGSFSLYMNEVTVLGNQLENPMQPYFEKQTVHYLGNENESVVSELTVMNYRKTLKKLMSDKPAIVQKIGKKGYRYHDLERIIREYNQ